MLSFLAAIVVAFGTRAGALSHPSAVRLNVQPVGLGGPSAAPTLVPTLGFSSLRSGPPSGPGLSGIGLPHLSPDLVPDRGYATMIAEGSKDAAEAAMPGPAILERMREKDPKIHSHMIRVGILSSLIALGMGLPPDQVRAMVWGGRLHDVGKIDEAVNAVANLRRALTSEEQAVMRRHAELGARLLSAEKDIPPDVLAAGVKAAMSHHERWDGTGYPQGLKGEEIPLEARVVAMADHLDALIENRPYRAGLSLDEAMKILESEQGHFDPEVWKVFKSLIGR